MAQDIVEILPFEIWERCIAEACQGENYMANLLTLTMVSAKWCQFLMETPTLWATIHLNDADEDSIASVAVFLQLSCEVQISLRIWAPLSETWKTVCSMLLRQNRRIREVTLQTDSRSHLAECSFQGAVKDAQFCDVLETIFKMLHYPASIRYIDVDLNRPVKMGSIWVPENLVSMGNWLVPWSILKPPGTFPRLRYLFINAVDLTRLLPHLSALGHLRHLYLHSDEQDYIQPPPPASSVVAPLSLPFLDNLRYHGRFYLAPTQLLQATSRTIQHLDLRIGILDLNLAVRSLEACHSLRCLSLTLLMLEYDLGSSNTRRPYLLMSVTSLMSKMKIPNWRLDRVNDFKCEMKTFAGGQIPQKLNVDYLWHLFHTIFPNLEGLVWNVPIQSNTVVASLIQQKRLRRFESHTVPESSYALPRGSTHPTLESLHIRDAQMFRGMSIVNLRHFSATFQEESTSFVGLTFGVLQSLNLNIGESVKNPWNLEPTNFPALKVLSIAFLGPRNGFQLPDLPSLTEITISTLSPTYTQAMDFCASLAYEPRKLPRLEQIDLDSLLEWDILYLLLRRRNILQKGSVSRIKRLRLPFMPPKLHTMFASLLSGRDFITFPFHWSMMTRLGIQGTQSRLLDPQIVGCFCCVQLGIAGCNEPLQASRLPEEYRTPRMGNHNISDVVESLGLFPIFNWDITRPFIREDSVYEDIWIVGHQERSEEWRNTACEWSKSHHRTLVCHKQLCSPKTMVTEYDAENEGTRPDIPPLAILSLSNFDEVLPNTTDLANAELHDGILATIPSLIKLPRDTNPDVRSNATSALAKLVVHAEPRDTIRAAIPSLIRLLEDTDPDRRSEATFALAELAAHAELRDAIEPTIPSLIKLLGDEHYCARLAATSALAKLMVHAELRDTIQAAIQSLIKLLEAVSDNTRSFAASALAELAAHAELCDAIGPAIPSLIRLLHDTDPSIRSKATSALAELVFHAELRDAIEPAVPSLIELIADENYYVRLAATSAFTKLVLHADLHDTIRAAIPLLIRLVCDTRSNVQSEATSILAKLMVHAEFQDAIRAAIASSIKLLEAVSDNTRSFEAFALAELAVHAELRDAIQAVIPSLIKLLEGVSEKARSSAASALAGLAVHAGLRDAIEPAIPSLIRLLHDTDSSVRSKATSALAELVAHELRGVIEPAIPSLVKLIDDENYCVRLAATSALAELAVHDELHTAIRYSIQSLIKLLEAVSDDTRSSAASALAELAVHAELRDAIQAAFPSLIKLLQEAVSEKARSSAASALAGLVVHAEHRNPIESTIPSLVRLPSDTDSSVRSEAVLSELAAYAEHRNPIESTIPSLFRLLRDTDSSVRSEASSVLSELAAYAELHDAIKPAFPSLIRLLSDTEPHVRSEATSALTELAVHAELRDAVELAIPSLIRLLHDTDSSVRSKATSALAELAVHAQFCDAILVATPFLVELLESNRSGDSAASALAELAAYTGFSDAIRPAIPSLIGQLQDPGNDVRFTATSMLATLAQDDELCDEIRPAVPSLMELFSTGDPDIQLAAAAALARLLPFAHDG